MASEAKNRTDYAKLTEDQIHIQIANANRRMMADMATVQELTAALIIKKRDRKANDRKRASQVRRAA